MKTYEELKKLFSTANEEFIKDDIDLFESHVSERSLCGALMLHINRYMIQSGEFDGYYTDIEYNRNRGNINIQFFLTGSILDEHAYKEVASNAHFLSPLSENNRLLKANL